MISALICNCKKRGYIQRERDKGTDTHTDRAVFKIILHLKFKFLLHLIGLSVERNIGKTNWIGTAKKS
jgi:hypothetical protein